MFSEPADLRCAGFSSLVTLQTLSGDDNHHPQRFTPFPLIICFPIAFALFNPSDDSSTFLIPLIDMLNAVLLFIDKLTTRQARQQRLFGKWNTV
jgi:hypothetical protein